VATAAEPAGAGNTPLAAAAGFGRVAVVAALLDRGACSGADVDAALVRAAEFGHLDTVVHLLARGADPACSRRDPEGKGPGGNALHAAAERGHSAVLEALLENAEPSSLMVTDAYGRTPVEAAARWGHADAIRVCLRVSPGSAEINPTNLCLLAVRWGHEDALRASSSAPGQTARARRRAMPSSPRLAGGAGVRSRAYSRV
jgi:ankyrin repeat protein